MKCKKKDLATTISDEITLSFVMVWNEVKNKQSHTVGTIPKQNIKTVERNKFDTLNKQIHDCSLYRNSCISCLMKPTGPRPLIYTNSTSIDSALQIHVKRFIALNVYIESGSSIFLNITITSCCSKTLA